MAVVVIPVFQPDKTLISIADKLWSLGYGIIVVDDGSGEEYQHIFEAVSDISIILHHTENRGKGAAIKTALNYIKNEMWDSDVIGIMELDEQYTVECMRKVLEFAGNHRKGLVLGVRNLYSKMPLSSRLGNWTTKEILHLISGVRVSDTQTGLRAFSSELIKKILYVQGERYEYEINVLIELARSQIPIAEIPVDAGFYNIETGSHYYSFNDAMTIYRDLLKLLMLSFSNYIVDYLLFVLFMILLPHTAVFVFLANAFARAVSTFYNYTLNSSSMFYINRKAGSKVEYISFTILSFAADSVILGIFDQMLHFSVYPAKILTEIIMFFISLAVYAAGKDKRKF